LGVYSSFRGVAVDTSSILITYTRTGDATLDGIVDIDDVTIVNAAYNPSRIEPRWAYGDFDMDTAVGDDDATLLGALFDPSAQPYTSPRAAPFALIAECDDGSRAAIFAHLGWRNGEFEGPRRPPRVSRIQ
jgi:hypothetical protein